MPQSALRSRLQPENQAGLRALLAYHVVPGRLSTARSATARRSRPSESGGHVVVGNASGMATVTQADVYASNGVAHVVDGVLMP